MMRLEDQVCDLELAKKLKELGVKQGSFWWWVQNKGLDNNIRLTSDKKGYECAGGWNFYSALNVAELGEMLPKGFRSGKMENGLFKVYNKNPQYQPKGTGEIRDNTEANARGKMLIYLLENKLIEGGKE